MIAGPHRKELSAGYQLTTNNRMELLGVIVALQQLKRPGSKATVFSDSRYVVDSVEKGWVFGWEKKSFAKKKNADLWREFLKIYHAHHIKFHWVKGHADNRENQRCDELATAAAMGSNLLEDTGYLLYGKLEN
jgi:ribonuclease HI